MSQKAKNSEKLKLLHRQAHKPRNRPSVCFVFTSPMVLNAFLLGHLQALADRYRVTVCTNTNAYKASPNLDPRIELLHFPIERPVRILLDLKALLWLLRLFYQQRFDSVSSLTPKGGLLAMLAAILSGVSLRIHMFTGQVWVTRSGWKRGFLRAVDRLIACLATHVLTDSPSQREFMIGEGIVIAEKIRVLAEGSICGVDGERFRPDYERRAAVRAAHGIPQEAVVFLFMGRLNRDKGVLDLADAFAALHGDNAWLLIVGPDEEGIRHTMKVHLGLALLRCSFVGYTERPEDYMAAADVFCLPSYREGFGMVIIEAAAAGIPAIGSRIYGITDAIEDGVTGLMHRVGDVSELTTLMTLLGRDASLRKRMGEAARTRALRLFSHETVTRAWLHFYRQLLG